MESRSRDWELTGHFSRCASLHATSFAIVHTVATLLPKTHLQTLTFNHLVSPSNHHPLSVQVFNQPQIPTGSTPSFPLSILRIRGRNGFDVRQLAVLGQLEHREPSCLGLVLSGVGKTSQMSRFGKHHGGGGTTRKFQSW